MNPARIAAILVAPENVDNIGAAARAVKNMGFSDLRLVRPPQNWKTKGKKMAMSAVDVLKKARPFESLAAATRDLTLVIGTTRRSGAGRGLFVSFPEAISMIREKSGSGKIGIVFGCESKGLANRDIQLCDHLVTIPTGVLYPSLNLAQAVMVTLFALSSTQNLRVKEDPSKGRFLTQKEILATMRHFEKALWALGYRKGGADLLPRILQTLRGLLKRSGLLEPEAQMIKGLSRRIKEKVLSCQCGDVK